MSITKFRLDYHPNVNFLENDFLKSIPQETLANLEKDIQPGIIVKFEFN